MVAIHTGAPRPQAKSRGRLTTVKALTIVNPQGRGFALSSAEMDAPRPKGEPRVGSRKRAYQLTGGLRTGDPQTVEHINQVLEHNDGHVLSAAAALGVSSKTLRDWAKQFPALGPFRDHRGQHTRRMVSRKMPTGALIAITEREDQVIVELLRLRGHRDAVASVREAVRRRFGDPRVHYLSGTMLTVADADSCGVRVPISDALDAAGLEHRWLVGARRSQAVPS